MKTHSFHSAPHFSLSGPDPAPVLLTCFTACLQTASSGCLLGLQRLTIKNQTVLATSLLRRLPFWPTPFTHTRRAGHAPTPVNPFQPLGWAPAPFPVPLPSSSGGQGYTRYSVAYGPPSPRHVSQLDQPQVPLSFLQTCSIQRPPPLLPGNALYGGWTLLSLVLPLICGV